MVGTEPEPGGSPAAAPPLAGWLAAGAAGWLAAGAAGSLAGGGLDFFLLGLFGLGVNWSDPLESS